MKRLKTCQRWWYSSLWETHLRATEHHPPYGITQCYLPPNRGECTPPKPQPDSLVLDLPTLEGWNAELSYVAGYIPRWFTCLQAVTHPSANLVWRRVTSLIGWNTLPLRQATGPMCIIFCRIFCYLFSHFFWCQHLSITVCKGLLVVSSYIYRSVRSNRNALNLLCTLCKIYC